MDQANKSFFTVIGCIDGRVQSVAKEYGADLFSATYPDTITEAGSVGVLARNAFNKEFFDPLSKKLFISISDHLSKGILIYGHEDCAGNPVSDKKHIEEIRNSVALIKEIVGEFPPVAGIFVKKDPTNSTKWIVEQV